MKFCINDTRFDNLADASNEGYYQSLRTRGYTSLIIRDVEVLHHKMHQDRSITVSNIDSLVAFVPNPRPQEHSGNFLRIFHEDHPSSMFVARDFADLCLFTDLDSQCSYFYKKAILDKGYKLLRVHRKINPNIPYSSLTDLHYGTSSSNHIVMLTEAGFNFFISNKSRTQNIINNDWQKEGF